MPSASTTENHDDDDDDDDDDDVVVVVAGVVNQHVLTPCYVVIYWDRTSTEH